MWSGPGAGQAAGACSEPDGGAGTGEADAALLSPLTEESFVHNLHVRYRQDIIYTYVGNALVSVNPCRALPLYSAELVRIYLSRAPHSLPPHLYALAAAAIRRVRDADETQCIVMTGESGAGKTEAARVCLQCAVLTGPASVSAAALTAAGTLLEAFGNAATARNHNASRFGKLLEIEFDFKGEPVGGHIMHSCTRCACVQRRACGGVCSGERNFHVLYQVLAGADVTLLKRLRLRRSWEQYRVLRAPGSSPSSPRAAAQDREHFAFTMAALRALGLAGEAEAVLRLLAFLLKLANVEFEPQSNIDGSLGTRLHRIYELQEACALVGVDPQDLEHALGAADDEPGVWAGARRDALLCELYARLFAWLVARVNEALGARGPARRAHLALLDVYGLEALAHNALERLLINYAAERVQAAVTDALRREQDEYVREGLVWRSLPFPPHDALADLLDVGPDSVLGVLRECSLRGASDAAFLQCLQRRRHPHLAVLPPDSFQVLHFGGAVNYCARAMLAHNRDALCRRCCSALAAAHDPLLATLFPESTPASPRRATLLSCRQRALVGALVRRLPPAPRLVRCLRADAALRPHRFDAALVRQQIRQQGILEMAELRRSGWCESMCARVALARYSVLGDRRAVATHPEPVRAVRALLRTVPIPGAEFAYGRTRIFVRSPRALWELETLRAARVDRLVAAAQRAWRRHRVRRRNRAQAVIARAWRTWRGRRAEKRGEGRARDAAARVVWRTWCASARRRYLVTLWARLPARHASPACAAWPPCPAPRLLGRTDALLRRLHHAWRCRLYRAAFDQTARNRMREKVTASVLFRERKASYADSVAHPFVGDYVRLRASSAWRRGAGALDRCVVFADVVGKVARASGRVARALCVLSTSALLLLDARSLRARRRVPAHHVWRLSLSPHHDDVLVVHVRACPAHEGEAGGALTAPGCLFAGEGAWRRRGDVVLRTCHVLELATKLFLVVQNAVGAAPVVHIASEFEANFGQQLVTLSFHAGAGAGVGGARLLRRGSHMDVLL